MTGEVQTEDGQSAAYRAQIRALALKPWQSPPCCFDPEDEGRTRDERVMIGLLRRMLAAGVSKWSHDPLGDLERKGGTKPREGDV
jgi:hypothetical protein